MDGKGIMRWPYAPLPHDIHPFDTSPTAHEAVPCVIWLEFEMSRQLGVGCSRIVGAGRKCCPTLGVDGGRDWSACSVLTAANQGALGIDGVKNGGTSRRG